MTPISPELTRRSVISIITANLLFVNFSSQSKSGLFTLQFLLEVV